MCMPADVAPVCFQYYNKGGMPSRSLTNDICAVCGQRILVNVEEEGFIEDTYQLSCGHLYPKALLFPTGPKAFYNFKRS